MIFIFHKVLVLDFTGFHPEFSIRLFLAVIFEENLVAVQIQADGITIYNTLDMHFSCYLRLDERSGDLSSGELFMSL